jgi:hypothetical protein
MGVTLGRRGVRRIAVLLAVVAMAAAGGGRGPLRAHAVGDPPIIETTSGPILGTGGAMASLSAATYSVGLPLAAPFSPEGSA